MRSSTRTAIAEPLLVDTNILVEATDSCRRFHDDATALIESGGALVFPAQVIREYLTVATRPADANGLGMPLSDALENVREFRRTIRLLPEERPVLPAFLRLLAAVPCAGARIHDAHLVATALAHRVGRIVSLNPGDLLGFTAEIAVVGPSDALRESSRVKAAGIRRARPRPRRR